MEENKRRHSKSRDQTQTKVEMAEIYAHNTLVFFFLHFLFNIHNLNEINEILKHKQYAISIFRGTDSVY